MFTVDLLVRVFKSPLLEGLFLVVPLEQGEVGVITTSITTISQ